VEIERRRIIITTVYSVKRSTGITVEILILIAAKLKFSTFE
jgi:hypothetical protein